MSRAKNWCFTSFNVENEPVYDTSKFQYLIYGRETCPDTSRKHLQGFMVLKKRSRLTEVRKIIPNAHFEVARGLPSQAADYCKKDGDFKEYGQLPSYDKRGNKFSDVLKKAEVGDFDYIRQEYPGLYLLYKTNLHSSFKFCTAELNDSCGIWICGPPRCGKDYAVRQIPS